MSTDFHHVNVCDRVVIGRRRGSLISPCHAYGYGSLRHIFPLWKRVHQHSRMLLRIASGFLQDEGIGESGGLPYKDYIDTSTSSSPSPPR
jgi:hypothetical protein